MQGSEGPHTWLDSLIVEYSVSQPPIAGSGAGMLLVIVHDVLRRELAVMDDGFDDEVGVWLGHSH